MKNSATPSDSYSARLATSSFLRVLFDVTSSTKSGAFGSRHITIEPGKRGGKPCIGGMRITVYDVLEYLASGMSEQEILDDFPDLTHDDIRACLSFAADRERKLVSLGES